MFVSQRGGIEPPPQNVHTYLLYTKTRPESTPNIIFSEKIKFLYFYPINIRIYELYAIL